jgi:hypothetical protein
MKGNVSPHYKECMDIWFVFYKRKSGGITPRINSRTGKCLNSVIDYFNSASKTHTPTQCLQFVFDNWDRLDSFLSDKIDIVDIDTFLNKILLQIKNGKPTTESKQQSLESRIVAEQRELERKINGAIGS